MSAADFAEFMIGHYRVGIWLVTQVRLSEKEPLAKYV